MWCHSNIFNPSLGLVVWISLKQRVEKDRNIQTILWDVIHLENCNIGDKTAWEPSRSSRCWAGTPNGGQPAPKQRSALAIAEQMFEKLVASMPNMCINQDQAKEREGLANGRRRERLKSHWLSLVSAQGQNYLWPSPSPWFFKPVPSNWCDLKKRVSNIAK